MARYNVLDSDGGICGVVDAESPEAAVARVVEMQKKQNLPVTAVSAEERPERVDRIKP